MENHVFKTLLTPLLAPASIIYRCGLWIDRSLRSISRARLTVPVISIGNLTLGGTGKTPMLIKLLSDLNNWGHRPAVLTRGYRSFDPNGNDETALLKQAFPDLIIGIGAKRVLQANKILSCHNPTVFILDDGFQHWSMHRNLDIVCIDATDPWGGGHLLPWGRLREPRCALSRANVVVITRSELVSPTSLLTLQKEISLHVKPECQFIVSSLYNLLDSSGQPCDIHEVLKGRTILAVSALGNPLGFEGALEQWSVPVLPYRFRDHHHYCDRDKKRIVSVAKQKNALVVTTAKDWVKLNPFPGAYVLNVRFCFSEVDQNRWKQQVNQ